MRAVGIKVLKARLSEFVRLVKAGETILVTERDEVVAELRPAQRQPINPRNLSEALAALADRGEVTLASEPPGTWKGFQNQVSLKGISSRQILDALRDEG